MGRNHGETPAADLARAFFLYLVTRTALGVFVWLTGQHYVCYGPRCTDRGFFPKNFLLNALFQWDAYQYVRLIRYGYYVGREFDTTVPYFPGFPLGAHLLGKLLGSPLWGGIVLNHAASVAGAFLLTRLVRRLALHPWARTDEASVDATAREATLFWLASPLTLFYCVFLSESLFALASVLVIWSVVTGRWALALVGGLVATATRNAGVLVVGAALVLAWERRREVRVPWFGWLAMAGGLAGLGVIIWLQWHALGDGFAWVTMQTRWNRFLVWPWVTLHDDWLGWPRLDGRNVDAMYRSQEVLALALTAPLLLLRRRLGLPWGVWLLGVAEWLLPLTSHSLISSARYQAGNVYFALAIPALLAGRHELRAVVWLLFGMVLAWYASTYPFGNWAS